MADVKVNLNKIKEEIEARKAEKGIVPQNLGAATGRFAAPKDEFLNGLLTSLKTGQDTPSTNLLREVEHKVAVKNGEKPRARVPGVTQDFQQPQQQRPPAVMGESFDREERMYQDLNTKKNQTLADAIQSGITPGRGNTQQPQQQNEYRQQPQMVLNEAAIVENVRSTVNEYLAISLMPILEESTRSTIIEMYAVETIKKTLTENKELIRGIVYEVIREIQAKQKPK